MTLSQQTERAIESCYNAVMAPHLWPGALQELAESLGAASGTFFNRDRGDGQVPMSSGHREFADLWLRNQFHAPCPISVRAPLRYLAGYDTTLQQEIISEEEMRRSAYFNETARPAKREWWAATGWSVGDKSWCISFYRTGRQGPFSPREAARLRLLQPHLARITSLADRLSDAGVLSALSALERLRSAALVIDGRGAAIHMNALAEDLLGEDFNLVRGLPAARDASSNRALRKLVAAAASQPRGGEVPLHGRIVINRDGVPWLLVEVMPITEFASDVFGEARAVLLLTDLAAPRVADSALLAYVFGLTAAEAKLAGHITSGSGLDEAASGLGVARETARSQLKAVFLKTNTRRQAELVALAGRLRPLD
jgi:DNA-binding CsgD family transcriptional regulator